MIKLKKLSEPLVLKDNKHAWLGDLKAAKKSAPERVDEIRHRYRDSEVKDQIVRETNGKCAYCESKMRHVDPGQIEHMIPFTVSEDDVFEWENLTLACPECNRRKNALFDPDQGFLNPYKDDPSAHLFPAGPLVMPRPGSTIGKITELGLELNRMQLIEQRTDAIVHVNNLLDQYALEPNALLRKLQYRKLNELKRDDQEFAMVVKAHLKSVKISKP